MDEKMEKMMDVIRQYDARLIDKDSYRSYLAPEIPDRVVEKVMKIYDKNMSAKDIVAFYDISLFHTFQNGFVFMADGFYRHYIGKAEYIRYCDIKSICVTKDRLTIILITGSSFDEYICEMNLEVFRDMMEKLRTIDAEYGALSHKTSGKVKAIDLPENMMKECNVIIHSASVAAGAVGTGLAQIPVSDNAVIVPIQITMITTLGKKVFDLNITESAAKSIIASAGASVAGRTVVQILWGWIPGVGNAINTATATGLTETIGWIAVADFHNRWLEDHNKGRYTGMKDGYNAASREYEAKLRKQADEFIRQKKVFAEQMDEYEILLHACEAYISELREQSGSDEHLREMEELYRKLMNLKSGGEE